MIIEIYKSLNPNFNDIVKAFRSIKSINKDLDFEYNYKPILICSGKAKTIQKVLDKFPKIIYTQL